MLCPRCHTTCPPGAQYCPHCRQNLDVLPGMQMKKDIPQISHAAVRYTIGRSKDNDLQLSDNSVSRHHAVLYCHTNNSWLLEDLSSKNGTFVDGRRIRIKHVTSSSRIAFGKVCFLGDTLFKSVSLKQHFANTGPVVRSMASGGKRQHIDLLAATGAAAVFVMIILFWLFQNSPPAQEAKLAERTHNVQDVVENESVIENKIEKATVLVVVQTCSGYGLGSGFFINGNTVLTNRHVVQNASRIMVLNKHLGAYMANILTISRNQNQDYAVLKTESEVLQVEPLSFSNSVHRGDRVSAWGYPGVVVSSFKWQGDVPEVVVTSGDVNMIREGLPRIIVHSAMLAPGNSGGPLVNSSGKVIGINALALSEKSTDIKSQYQISFSAEDIMHFLKDERIDFKQE